LDKRKIQMQINITFPGLKNNISLSIIIKIILKTFFGPY